MMEGAGLAAAMLSQGVVREALTQPAMKYTAMVEQEKETTPFPNPFLPGIHKYVAEEDASDKSTVLFRKLKAPVHEPVQFYSAQSRGLSEREAEARLDLYAKNEFSIPRPCFADMFKQPLLERLTVFQIFSVCLYILDEYWQYSLFTMEVIIMFEGVTVMSRLKNLQTLCVMGYKAREVYLHREKTWEKVNYDQLVPW
ncbi:hypothetical protein PsorP6_010106 [Peronosclerospora sorghi]|uniref:Uncharacterized protein n=1 Tax=Peronosclerospora sorghi TaxID=230839 RepID=A0ACC0VWG6_9STRA|nr:hypothetical protein PsorP6_010106 [Peronosclerospora sorghi]